MTGPVIDEGALRALAEKSRDNPVHDRLSRTYNSSAHLDALAARADLGRACDHQTILALLDELARLRSALPVDRGYRAGIEDAAQFMESKHDPLRAAEIRSLPDLPVQTEDR